MAYRKQSFVNGVTKLKAEHLQKIEEGILEIADAAPLELFEGLCTKDFFLKAGTTADGTSTVFPVLSNTNNSRLAVIDLEDGETYTLNVSNTGDASTYRMRICTYAESYSDLIIAPLGSNATSLDAETASPAVDIIVNESNSTTVNTYSGTFTNTNNAKTMIIMAGWGTDESAISISVTKDAMHLGEKVLVGVNNLDDEARESLGSYEPWGGYLDPNVYKAQDVVNLTNALRANMDGHNLATTRILEIAYNFWKRRNEFIYCMYTALDKPWDYWSYVGFVDSSNTGMTVGEGHGGYKRIDCSTFVRYVVNGIDYYSTPYYNALEWTEVTQGALTDGVETDSDDVTVCRTGKMYVRLGKKHIVESSASSSYSFTGIYAYNSSDEIVQDLTGNTSFTLSGDVAYIRAEMKVLSADNYAPAVKGESPAAILRCLRIRESETLSVNAGCPTANRNAYQMCQWFDNNGYGLSAFDDYNPLFWDDADFKPGTVVFMGKTTSSNYKGITHVTIYVGGGYIIHSQAPRGLLGGEGIMIDQLRDMEYRYDRPFCSAASPKYHTDFSEEKALLGIAE